LTWLSGWSYRKSHEIEGSTAGAQTNYQIRVKVHRTTGTDSGEDVYVGTKCRADFGDIRFTKSDGVTELDYWLEEYDGDVAVFWVEVPSIPASPDTATIYIYYGKSDATTTSNFNNTFINDDDYFDDQTDGALPAGWTEWKDPAYGHFEVDSANAKHGSKGAELYQSGTSGKYYRCRKPFSITEQNAIDFWVKFDTDVANDYAYFFVNDQATGEATGIHLGMPRLGYIAYKDSSGWHNLQAVSANTWYHILIYNIDLANDQFDIDIDGTNVGTNLSFRAGVSSLDYIHVGGTYHYPTYYWIDTLIQRKWVDPEPSHGAWGSEETPAVAWKVTVAEKLGLADSIAKRADYATLVSGVEKLGLAETVTKRVDFRTLLSGREKLGLIDTGMVQTVIPLLVVEKLGLADAFTKRVDYHTLQSGVERLGLADELVKRVQYRTLQSGTEKLGLADTALLKRSAHVFTVEQLGLADQVKPTARYHIYIDEVLGLKDYGVAGKLYYLTVTEKLGLKDEERILLTIYTPAVTVPANTPKDAPVTYMLFVEEDYVTSIDVYFPTGCCGYCRVQAYYGSEQIAPKPTGADFRGDGMIVRCPLRWRVPEKPCPIRFVLWNLDDTYSHTPIIFVTTAMEEQVKPYKPFSEFVHVFKRLVGVR